MKDLMGKAIWDYYHQHDYEDIETETSISEMDILPVEYLFRKHDEMSKMEQKALELSNGKVLDIGAAAGCHSLYLQNEKKLDVTALDVSPRSIEVCKLQGLKNTLCENILELKSGKWDTLLLLMNGTGIFESLRKIDKYLKKLYNLLDDNGQILIDGTDILYMYDRDKDGGVLIPAGKYYGEVDYFLYYKNEPEMLMKWLYLDFNTLKNAAKANGFSCENILQDGDAYLARLTKLKVQDSSTN